MGYLILGLTVFIIDQASKKVVSSVIKPGSHVEVIKDKFYLTNVRNKGAAFGLFANNPKMLFASTFWAACYFFYTLANLFKEGVIGKAYSCSLAFLMGGAMGNLTDRIRLKYVTDFLYIKFSKKPPVFNMADFFILTGTIIFVTKQFFSKSK